MDYKETLKLVEDKIEFYIKELLFHDLYKSTKTEEYLRTYCATREYLKEKIKEESEVKNEG